jgi:hypothetical protein
LIFRGKNDLFVSFSGKDIFSEIAEGIFGCFIGLFGFGFFSDKIVENGHNGFFIVKDFFVFGVVSRQELKMFVLVRVIVFFPRNSLRNNDHLKQEL